MGRPEARGLGSLILANVFDARSRDVKECGSPAHLVVVLKFFGAVMDPPDLDLCIAKRVDELA